MDCWTDYFSQVEKCKTNFVAINDVLSECDKLNPNSTSGDKLCECFNGNGGDAAKWKEMLVEAKACKVLKSFNDKTTASHKVALPTVSYLSLHNSYCSSLWGIFQEKSFFDCFLLQSSLGVPQIILIDPTFDLQECTKAFKKCSSAKKEAPKLFFSCTQTTDALKKKAAAVILSDDITKEANFRIYSSWISTFSRRRRMQTQ